MVFLFVICIRYNVSLTLLQGFKFSVHNSTAISRRYFLIYTACLASRQGTHPVQGSLINFKSMITWHCARPYYQAIWVTILVQASTTIAKTNGNNTDPWCTPTFTSNSSDNSSPWLLSLHLHTNSSPLPLVYLSSSLPTPIPFSEPYNRMKFIFYLTVCKRLPFLK